MHCFQGRALVYHHCMNILGYAFLHQFIFSGALQAYMKQYVLLL